MTGGKGQRSEQTKNKIVEAAHALFIENGYAGTTFQAVADAAGVSVQTVYFHYGSKSRLLRRVVDAASAGDGEPGPLLDRPSFAALREPADPATAIRLWVRESGAVLDRVAPVLTVVRDAAPGDPDMAAQWADDSARRRAAHGAFIAVLTGLHAVRHGLSERRAVDVAVALLSPELFLVLTRECGWTAAEWEGWAADQLAHALLPG
ncbi:TetR/AcrR family transcriptional regulator [Planotetraspora kaengkrachanensis]|uniref:TetR family transcriptional regulator n=1 Tax=Planotetraspora kaengkrachanensis TaxID=575193 RepID=A0A8J3PSB7_9ACTN|nr:TetR/AcrR family transcriptional regulator [Planotetraspora kaengkrachanensis]GIG78056.1 TetR family transcriptional regulator [Planotetraspora kaengkrachanensis]